VTVLLAVAHALPSTTSSVSDSTVSSFDSSYDAAADAKDTVAVLLQEGKDEGACASLAAASIKEVEDSVASAQKILGSLDTGAECPKEGQEAVDQAQTALGNAKQAATDANTAAAKAASAPVKFNPIPFSGLQEGNCGTFFSDPVYVAAKNAAKAAQDAATKAAGAATAAQAALDAAQKAQQEAVAQCQNDARCAYDKAWEAANKENDSNGKVYTKGKHMTCVLEGTPPADCQVGDVPAVKPLQLAEGVPATCTEETPAIEVRTGGYMSSTCPSGTTTLSLAECKNVASNGPYDAITNKDGSPVAASAKVWSQDSVAYNHVPHGCVYQTDHGFWYGNPPNGVGSAYASGQLLCKPEGEAPEEKPQQEDAAPACVCAVQEEIPAFMQIETSEGTDWIEQYTINSPQDGGSLIPHPGGTIKMAVRCGKYCENSDHTWGTTFSDANLYNIQKVTDFKNVGADVSILWDLLPKVAHSASETANVKSFLGKGGRFFIMGENNNCCGAENTRVSESVAALGGAVKIRNQDGGQGTLTQKNLNKLQVTSGLTEVVTAAWAALKVDKSVSEVIATNNNGDIFMADQQLEKGRITVWADINVFDQARNSNTHNGKFWKNLVHQGVNFVKAVENGQNPNANGPCQC
jgi:hypothetical protein